MNTAFAAACVAFSLSAHMSMAQPPAGEKGLPPVPLIALRRAALAEFVSSPKDARLKDALAMIDARLAELPEESDGQIPQAAADAAILGLRMLSSPARLAIVYNPSSNAGGTFGYGLVMASLPKDPTDSQRAQGFIEEAIQQSGERLPPRSSEYPDMREMRTPAGKFLFGPRAFHSGTGYEVRFGTIDDPDGPFESIPQPDIEGLIPMVTGTFDFSALTPLANFAQSGMKQAAGADGGRAPDVVAQLSETGVIGDRAMKGFFELGHTKDALRFRVRVENARGALAAGGIDTGRLTQDHFTVVPADAITASIGLLNLDSISRSLGEMRKQGLPVDEYLGKFREATGVDVEKDFVGSLGGASAIYCADSTGGGGLLSYVGLVSFKDRAKFLAAHEKLRVAAERALADQSEEPDGRWARYLRIRSWTVHKQPAFSLTFPGLPIPLELSWAVTDKWLVVGLTPQAVGAAVWQAIGKGDKGLLARDDLHLFDVDKQELISVSFVDTKRTLREGYGVLTLIGSSIANGVRSPLDEARDPGLIIPSFGELMDGVRPAISVAYRQGGALVIESASDPSWLVNFGSAAGAYGRFLPLVALLGGIGAAAQQNHVDLGDLGAAWPRVEPTGTGGRDIAWAPLKHLLDGVEGPLAWFSQRRLAAAWDLIEPRPPMVRRPQIR